jgi:hypothetical protein
VCLDWEGTQASNFVSYSMGMGFKPMEFSVLGAHELGVGIEGFRA